MLVFIQYSIPLPFLLPLHAAVPVTRDWQGAHFIMHLFREKQLSLRVYLLLLAAAGLLAYAVSVRHNRAGVPL